ncbi:MAG TPA: hypothetical protein P5284_08355 [Candidatus Contendobacter sp.]|nr:hypothetical protein [Candidatus Contendobacter sp.]HRZ53165.1 hypothetical protein [Candidatus Contendobacter sp.]
MSGPVLLQRETFELSRMMEFFSERELTAQIGHSRTYWPVALLKELLDNSLDACESANIAPVLHVELQDDALIRDPEARAACLAWLYEGYRAWRNAGYALPESALATSATAEYWDDMNPFAQFARDVGLKFGKLERCPKPKLTGALKAWRDETGRFDASLKGFPGWLKSKGCFDQQITGGSRLWYGVGFAEASSQQSQESPPDSVNMAVDFQYSKSTDNFTVTAGDSGYGCYADSDDPAASPSHPADDGLSSHHQPVEATPADRNAPLPPTATADPGELWAILKHYRGWETFSQLAKKLGWPQSRVIAAAQELQRLGRASISGAMVKPAGEVQS